MDPNAEKIRALRKAETKAIHAVKVKDWALAKDYYDRLLNLATGWLDQGDPNVLWIKTHLSEALIELGKDDQAGIIHRELFDGDGSFDGIVPFDTDEEERVLEELFDLRVDITDKLLAHSRWKDALDFLRESLDYSLEAFGRRHDITVSIRESRAAVLKREQARIEREHSRSDRKKREPSVKHDNQASESGNVLEAIRQRSDAKPAAKSSRSPQIRLTTAWKDEDNEKALDSGMHAADAPGESATSSKSAEYDG